MLDTSKLDREYVRAVVRRYLTSASDVEDATQDALLSAVRHRSALRDPGAWRSWLHRTATNTALTVLRDRRAGRRCSEVFCDDPPELPAPAGEDAVIARDLLTKAFRAIEAMGPMYVETVTAIFLQELTFEEAERKHRVNINSLKARVHRVRQELHATVW